MSGWTYFRLCAAIAAAILGTGLSQTALFATKPVEEPAFCYHYKERITLQPDPGTVAVHLVTRTELSGADVQAFSVGPLHPRLQPLARGWWRVEASFGQPVLNGLPPGDVDFESPVFLDASGSPMVVTRDVLVGFHRGVAVEAVEAILAESGAGVILERNWAGMPGVYRARPATRHGVDVLAVANRLAERTEVKFAEPDWMIQVRGELMPDDPLFPSQWGLFNTGQDGGLPGTDIGAVQAWDITTGNPAISIAVIDDGVQLDHPDLNVLPGADCTDDNPLGGFGCTTAAPFDGRPVNGCDDHGTAVAGVISGKLNNQLGIAGVAPDCTVLPVRVVRSLVDSPCTNAGTLYVSWMVNALAYAESRDVRVTNNSNTWLFPAGVGAPIEEKYAQTRAGGMIHFASAGNSSAPLEQRGTVNWPSSIPAVNAISAVDRSGGLAFFSLYGPGLAFSAPGAGIWSTDQTGGNGYDPTEEYLALNGTSFASPIAAGVAALVLSVAPQLNPAQVEAILRSSATDLGLPGYDLLFGWGMVHAGRAVSAASGSNDCNGNGVDDWLDLQPAYAREPLMIQVFDVRTTELQAADVNGDGAVDLLASAGPGAAVMLNLGNGSRSFDLPVYYNADGGAWSLATGLLNADTWPDIAVANAFSNNVSVLMNDGTGAFQSRINYAAGNNPWGVIIADLNQDGHADVAVSNGGDDNVTILLNSGTGTFGAADSPGVQDYPHGLDAGDLDGDGDNDLVVTNGGSGSVSVLLNNGDGSFAGALNYLVGNGPRYVVLSDLNGDGKLDAAVANEHSQSISVLMNQGAGAFAGAVNLPVGANPHHVAAGDFNNDGAMDLASANRTSQDVSILLNNGNGTFAGADTQPTNADPWSIKAADFDGDGDDDLMIGHFDDASIAALWNNSAVWSRDCNGNLIPDECDIASSGSQDTNADGVPDECQSITPAVELISVSSGGEQGNQASLLPAMTPDGRYVAFSTASANLVDGDTNGMPDVFIRDRQSGTTQRVSISTAGTEANGGCAYAVLSADGRMVAWTSGATNLTPEAPVFSTDVYLRNLDTGITSMVSKWPDTGQAMSSGGFPGLSADGAYIAFFAFNLLAGQPDPRGLWIQEIVTGASVRLLVGGSPTSPLPSLSADGRYIAFAAGWIDGDSACAPHCIPQIYVYDRIEATTELVSVGLNAEPGNALSRWPSISADGTRIAFQSKASNLTAGGDTAGTWDVFVRDRTTGQTLRIVIDNPADDILQPTLSADGNVVAFTSVKTFLVPDDVQNSPDVFVYDLRRQQIRRVANTGLQGFGFGSQNIIALSEDGGMVGFASTRSDLVVDDHNGVIDVFVSRQVVLRADLDGDGDVDSSDGAVLASCTTGPSVPYAGKTPPGCALAAGPNGMLSADLDRDGDVDQVDFGVWQRCSGAPTPEECFR